MASSQPYTPVEVRVFGEFACFTRPEMKVERVSYEVMTPSAARGVLEAIFWKPVFAWRVREIRVLRDIRWFSLRRQEVNSRASYHAAASWAEHGGGYFADLDRTQRHTRGLRDVAYVIAADVALHTDIHADPAQYRDQFRRRVARGQCHHTPYLGCREFPADFSAPDSSEQPIAATRDLGRMLFDLEYARDGSGRGTPCFFDAALCDGVLTIPPTLYERQD